jgi:hypothetical protein
MFLFCKLSYIPCSAVLGKNIHYFKLQAGDLFFSEVKIVFFYILLIKHFTINFEYSSPGNCFCKAGFRN